MKPSSERQLTYSLFQRNKAWKHLQSNGLGDHANPDTIDQMKIKHPLRKNAITPLTGAELQDECKGIGRKDLENAAPMTETWCFAGTGLHKE